MTENCNVFIAKGALQWKLASTHDSLVAIELSRRHQIHDMSITENNIYWSGFLVGAGYIGINECLSQCFCMIGWCLHSVYVCYL
jgi:hypothetical protein